MPVHQNSLSAQFSQQFKILVLKLWDKLNCDMTSVIVKVQVKFTESLKSIVSKSRRGIGKVFREKVRFNWILTNKEDSTHSEWQTQPDAEAESLGFRAALPGFKSYLCHWPILCSSKLINLYKSQLPIHNMIIYLNLPT